MRKSTIEAVQSVHEALKAARATISVAESCTGGFLSHLLTWLPGSSAFFLGGAVTYSNESKVKVLGVPGEVIERFGAVSPECAFEMARGARTLFGSDYSLSITGNLGPDVLEGKERGLVFIGVARAGETLTRRFLFTGGRDENREEAAISALKALLGMIRSEEKVS